MAVFEGVPVPVALREGEGVGVALGGAPKPVCSASGGKYCLPTPPSAPRQAFSPMALKFAVGGPSQVGEEAKACTENRLPPLPPLLGRAPRPPVSCKAIL